MAIALVKHKNDTIFIINEKGQQTGLARVGYKENDVEILGWGGNNVSVRKGSYVSIFDEKGKKTGFRTL